MEIATWCASRRLQLNASKMEVIWFGSYANLAKMSCRGCSVEIDAEVLKPSADMHNLGIQLDFELTMKRHVAMVAASCFYPLRRIRKIRRQARKEVTTKLVTVFITSHLDYCNSVTVEKFNLI